MEEIINEQTEAVTSHTAEAEEVLGEESSVSYGKFKSVEALLSAYNSLQAEFTKRCQRIKELESNANKEKSLAEDGAPTVSAQGITPEKKEEILRDYLIEIERGKSSAIVMGSEGVGLKTPSQKPVTIAEAGKLVKEILNKEN